MAAGRKNNASPVSKKVKEKAPQKSPALKFLKLIRKVMAEIEADVPHLVKMGEEMAASLLDGGLPFTPRVARFWPSEMGHRAGGLMALRGRAENKKDVALFAVPDRRTWKAAEDENLRKLLKGKAKLLVVGAEEDLAGVDAGRVTAFTGGTDPTRGFYGCGKYVPLAQSRQFEQFVRGWIVVGEAVGACLRAEKVPTLWMSVWLEGAMARNAAMSFTEFGNFGEPRDNPETLPNPVFHRERFVPPLAAGYAAGEFLAMAGRYVQTLEDQAATLAEAGERLAATLNAGGRIWTVATGHSYPRILDVSPITFGEKSPFHNDFVPYGSDEYDYPLLWGNSASDILRGTPEQIGTGDAALYLGYAPLLKDRVDTLLKRGLQLIHTTPYGLRKEIGRDYHKNFLWFDLPWRPGDAQVDIPGYAARMMPGSSTAHSIAYNAILCELAERMAWKAK